MPFTWRKEHSDAGGVNSDEWLIKGSSTEGPAKECQQGALRNAQHDLCLCYTDYCNEKSEIGVGGVNNRAGISFKNTIITGGTGLMIVFTVIIAAAAVQ